jgi:hypothetical protein
MFRGAGFVFLLWSWGLDLLRIACIYLEFFRILCESCVYIFYLYLIDFHYKNAKSN